MYILYEGAMCDFPTKDKIIATTTGSWIDMVKANGFEPDAIYRVAFDGHNSYYDFGSWSHFVVNIE